MVLFTKNATEKVRHCLAAALNIGARAGGGPARVRLVSRVDMNPSPVCLGLVTARPSLPPLQSPAGQRTSGRMVAWTQTPGDTVYQH